MVTVPVLLLLAAVVWFTIRTGYATTLAALAAMLFGFMLGGTIAAPTIHHVIDNVTGTTTPATSSTKP